MGRFATPELAAEAYDAVVGPLGQPVNFPAPGSSQAQAVKASHYVGVSLEAGGKWHAKAQVLRTRERELKEGGVFGKALKALLTAGVG